MSWSSVALYTLTGTFTSPKEIEPFQIERISPVWRTWPAALCLQRRSSRGCGVPGRPVRQVRAGARDGQRRRQRGGLEHSAQRVDADATQLGALVGAQEADRPQRIDQPR